VGYVGDVACLSALVAYLGTTMLVVLPAEADLALAGV